MFTITLFLIILKLTNVIDWQWYTIFIPTILCIFANIYIFFFGIKDNNFYKK